MTQQEVNKILYLYEVKTQKLEDELVLLREQLELANRVIADLVGEEWSWEDLR